MNYRKFYEKQTLKKIPKDFDVHHLDLNRDNNDILNLVAIPKKLHIEYHISLSKAPIDLKLTVNVLKPSRINETGGKFFDFILENLIKYSEFKYEIEKWIIFRDVLLEKITIPDKFLTNKY